MHEFLWETALPVAWVLLPLPPRISGTCAPNNTRSFDAQNLAVTGTSHSRDCSLRQYPMKYNLRRQLSEQYQLTRNSEPQSSPAQAAHLIVVSLIRRAQRFRKKTQQPERALCAQQPQPAWNRQRELYNLLPTVLLHLRFRQVDIGHELLSISL